MPELPEITARAHEMKKELVGKTICGIEVIQPKCLNVSPEAFNEALWLVIDILSPVTLPLISTPA